MGFNHTYYHFSCRCKFQYKYKTFMNLSRIQSQCNSFCNWNILLLKKIKYLNATSHYSSESHEWECFNIYSYNLRVSTPSSSNKLTKAVTLWFEGTFFITCKVSKSPNNFFTPTNTLPWPTSFTTASIWNYKNLEDTKSI